MEKEEYYLLPKKVVDDRLAELNGISIKMTDMEENAVLAIKRNIGLLVSKSTLIDLSENAISSLSDDYVKSDLHMYNERYRQAGKKDYAAALTNLKIKLV